MISILRGGKCLRGFEGSLRRARMVRWQSSSGEDHNSAEDNGASVEDKLMDAVLKQVENSGWSQESIVKGAKDLGLSPAAHGIFLNGPIDLVHRYIVRLNRDTAESLRSTIPMKTQEEGSAVEDGHEKEKTKNDGEKVCDAEDITPESQVELLTRGLKTRLSLISPYRSTWHQALGLQALLINAKKSIQLDFALVDEIWYLAGDKSHDERWYTKRGALYGAMKASELAWLRDDSHEQTATHELIDRSVDALVRGTQELESVLTRGKATAMIISSTADSLLQSFRRSY